MKKDIKKVISQAVLILGICSVGISNCYADAISSAAEKAATGIQSTAAAALPYLLSITGIIMLMILILGGQRGRESVKEKIWWVVAGAGGIILIGGLVASVMSWF